MSHSLRFASRLLAVIGATATMIVLAATTAAAIVPPPDTDGWSHGAGPVTEPASSYPGLVVAAIIAAAVVAVAVAGMLALRAGRTSAARRTRLTSSTAR